jgi:hypothetical protein
MKSIKKLNLQRGLIKDNCKQIVLHIIDNTWVVSIIFFSKKTDMKFIILVSNLKEISPCIFSWKKEYIKNYDAILLSKYNLAEKRY